MPHVALQRTEENSFYINDRLEEKLSQEET